MAALQRDMVALAGMLGNLDAQAETMAAQVCRVLQNMGRVKEARRLEKLVSQFDFDAAESYVAEQTLSLFGAG